MVHGEDTLVAHAAVGGPRRLHLIAVLACARPHCFQIVNGLVTILHHTFDLTRDAFEPL